MTGQDTETADLIIIGGGINGAGIARDAAGRGLRVVLAEKGDLAQGTSSASTKLFHGGLRYLEFFEFGLVRKALAEREVLLRAMPHIAWPMRFVLPYHPNMRFAGDTPTSRLLARVMPWMKGRRPAWLIRAGLFLYDRLAGRGILPGTRSLDLARDPAGRALRPEFRKAYEYSDCWVDDSRLVVLNARDAVQRGAEVLTRHEVIAAERHGDHWAVTLRRADGRTIIRRARGLVNAGGPWVGEILTGTLRLNSREKVRLVRGSHIVTRRLFDHDKAYFLQGEDGRIIFAIPYENDFTLIGTTDQEHEGTASSVRCTEAERDYLCAFASRYFREDVTAQDVVWSYSGVRPLYDDGATSATAATRDYVLSLDTAGPVLLNVFGGKITTYRRLAEQALARIGPHLSVQGGDWTAGAPLPGGDFDHDKVSGLIAGLQAEHAFLTDDWARRLVRAYGTEAHDLLEGAKEAADLGRDFGATLTEAELRWLRAHEFARTAEDVVWRRSKLGLQLTQDQIAAIEAWMQAQDAEEAKPEGEKA